MISLIIFFQATSRRPKSDQGVLTPKPCPKFISLFGEFFASLPSPPLPQKNLQKVLDEVIWFWYSLLQWVQICSFLLNFVSTDPLDLKNDD
jgi:hypothetical protein